MNRPYRNDASGKRGKATRNSRPSALIAACAAVLAAAIPSVRADPIILINVTNDPLSTNPTTNTDFQHGLGFILAGVPTQFLIEINNPNAFGGNYRQYTFPAGGSLDSTSSWDFGDTLLKTTVAHFAGGNSESASDVIVTSVTDFTASYPLPGAKDTVVFGYLGPTGKALQDQDMVP